MTGNTKRRAAGEEDRDKTDWWVSVSVGMRPMRFGRWCRMGFAVDDRHRSGLRVPCPPSCPFIVE
jgi:hypothetical protein